MTLYGRSYTVTVDTIQSSELSINFRVLKTLEEEPNTADLIIRNLNPEHRRQLAGVVGGPVVRIEAGYLSEAGLDESGVIFSGQLGEVVSYEEGPTWITELHSGDEDERLATARTNRAYAAGTEVEDIVKDVISDLGIGAGNALTAVLTGNLREAGRQFLKGATFSGSSSKQLSRILKSMGKEWSVQDGEVQVIDKGLLLPGPAVRVNSGSGLIGSPTVGSDGILKFRALMNHTIVPGRGVEVSSKEVSEALYRVERAEYVGDTDTNDWNVDCEAALFVPALINL